MLLNSAPREPMGLQPLDNSVPRDSPRSDRDFIDDGDEELHAEFVAPGTTHRDKLKDL